MGGFGRPPVFKRSRQALPPVFQNFDGFGEIFGSIGPDSRNSRGLAGVGDGKEEVGFSSFGERGGMRYDASYPAEASVERELAENRYSFEMAVGESAFFGKYAQGDGEIERRSGFADFRGREIDRHPLLRERKSRIADGRTHAFTAFLYRRVAKAHDGKRRKSGGDVDFDGNGVSR